MPIHEFLEKFNSEGGTFEWLYLPEDEEQQAAIRGMKETYEVLQEVETSAEIMTGEIEKKKKKKKKSKIKKRG